MPETPNKFYLTTPIYYVNARPHIGHAYSTIAADVIARRHRLLGDDTFFLTGTDEHGQKVQRSAEKAGIPPQQFADEVSATFESLWKRMGITNDDYIRTTDERHKRGVQKLWRTLEERGAIYLSSYTGQYSIGAEAFVEGPPGTIDADGRLTETVTEENYFFRLSDYQQPIIDLIESGQLHIQPDAIRNEVLSFLRGGLKDLSISRTTFDWGVKVPGNDKHVVYVWLDALANYITAIGYGWDEAADMAKFAKYWPADLHLVGKEITRFHCVYWPAFLLALNPKLQHAADAPMPQLTSTEHAEWACKWVPKSVVAHGWLLFEESKMSKSRGNVVRTETILDAFGEQVYAKQFPASTKQEQDLFASDIIRYFLLREIPFGQDGSFSFDALITRYNADLANGYGNLVSRTLSMIQNYFDGTITAAPDGLILTIDDGIFADVEASLATYDFYTALKQVWTLIGKLDKTISDAAPWKLAKSQAADDVVRLQKILYLVADGIRISTAVLHPFMPLTTSRIWAQLGLGDIEEAARKGELKNLQWGGLQPGTKLGPLAPIFPRADKGLAQIMNDIEAANSTPSAPAAAASSEPTAEALNAVSPVAAATDHLPLNPDHSPFITIDDFIKVDLRIGQIVIAERIPKADKLLRLEVDLGPTLGRRQILSGIAEHYTPEELIGRRIAVIANLAPRKMRGLESHGMLLAASDETHTSKPILATFSDEVPLGSRIR